MYLIIHGLIVTPIVTPSPTFFIKGCKVQISGHSRPYSKIHVEQREPPFIFRCFIGRIELRYQAETQMQVNAKLTEVLELNQLGKFQSEGAGKIKWLNGDILKTPPCSYHHRRLRIRKGLLQNLSLHLQKLLQYALLHDFTHTEVHSSKIYQELPLTDSNLLTQLRHHHDPNPTDYLIRKFQLYDRRAAIITRRFRTTVHTRYKLGVACSTKVNFLQLATELAAVSTNVWKLYEYIYQSAILGSLNESFTYGYNSLQQHLLVIANLILEEYCPSQEFTQK